MTRRTRRLRPDQWKQHPRVARWYGANAKLTWAAVDAIRASPESGPVLGRRYGVHQSVIWMVKNHRTWKEAGRPIDHDPARDPCNWPENIR